jgi:hypothetical protein
MFYGGLGTREASGIDGDDHPGRMIESIEGIFWMIYF